MLTRLLVSAQAWERRATLQSHEGQQGPVLPVVGEVHVPQQAGGVLQKHVHLQNQTHLPERRQLEQPEPRLRTGTILSLLIYKEDVDGCSEDVSIATRQLFQL